MANGCDEGEVDLVVASATDFFFQPNGSQKKTFNKSTSTVYYISALPTRIYVDRILSQTQSRILQEITVQKLL